MRTFLVAAMFAATAISGFLASEAAAADVVAPATQAAATEQPWQQAQAVVRAVEADLLKGGIRTIQAHVADLERVLADADHPFGTPTPAGDRILLTDGTGQVLAALLYAATDKSPEAQGRKAVAMANPYPSASFYLGSYYNEAGKPADALRVLDAGLAAPGPLPNMPAAADHLPILINERGAALTALKQWPEALANYDKGLAIANLADPVRAILLRGRGFALTELGRLDESEKSYRDSLVAEPNNARALKELDYIARMRAGGTPTAPQIILRGAQPAPQ